ncbi:MAG: M23 family metallopeptidase [Longimicrobiales bacterium]|nr:M23 family metallopeptidase [Longimicrobiales bacterium]
MKTRLWAYLIGVLGLLAAGVAVVYPEPPDPAETAPTLAPVYAPPAELMTTRLVRHGETLSEVFARAELPASERGRLALAVQEQVNPRRIRPNTPVVIRRWAEDGSPRTVEVALNADSTVLLRRSPVGWDSDLRLTPTRVDTVAFAGRLGSGGSLYAAVVDHPDLAALPFREREALVWRMATSVYGWQLDFAHDMRPGDSYRVVFEREARPDGSSRSNRVLVAEIVNQGDTIPAIHFDPGDRRGDYFGDDGESLRLAFLRYPVDYPRITSNFSWRRYHPILKRNRPHLGTDFGTGRGAPVRSTADGVVRSARWDGGYGNLAKIYHGNGYETRYAHLSRFAPGIRPGVRVTQGQIIGYSGDTGLATAPHLHYELRQHGQPRDPRRVRLPAAPPVPEDRMERFQQVVTERLALLPALPAPQPETIAAR